MTDGRPSRRFPRTMRLTHDQEFQHVFDGQVRHAVGPVVVYGRPNGLECSRLGLTVSRRVGGAVLRNRIKRLLRESFRLDRHTWPASYDLVIVVRPHHIRTLDDYRAALTAAVASIHEQWTKHRPARTKSSPPEASGRTTPPPSPPGSA
ncbi:MAG: ribonuclease P protein component [Phycisphaeraceae bacterium]|nr:ribonuclease P protein component [Phycisphaerales bacterium]QOJ18685.1 MAG: ribonuclease P protein component [Phycisphaeraceae bacterium]